MKCNTCDRGWPTVRVETYWGPEGTRELCDNCLHIELPQDQPAVAFGPSWYVAQDGSERELPSYAS